MHLGRKTFFMGDSITLYLKFELNQFSSQWLKC